MRKSLVSAVLLLVLAGCRDVLAPERESARLRGTSAALATGTWETQSSLPFRLYAHAATLGPDGNIYVFGGLDDAFQFVPALRFVVSSGTWQTLPTSVHEANMGLERAGDGTLLLMGGMDLGAGGPVSLVRRYDVYTGVLSSAPAMSVTRYSPATAATPNGNVYAIGGFSGGFMPTASAELFANSHWVAIAPLPAARGGAAGASDANGFVYVFGGADVTNAPTNDAFRYDPNSDAWAAIAPLPVSLILPRASRGRDGLIYITGGQNSVPAVDARTWAYDPAADTYTQVASMQSPRYVHAAVTADDGYIYAFGGTPDGANFTSSVERLLTPIPVPPNQSPIARLADVGTVLVGASVTFDASESSDPDGDALEYIFSFSDGIIIENSGAIVTRTFATAGTYTVGVLVRDPHGATGVYDHTFTVVEPEPEPEPETPEELVAELDAMIDALVASGHVPPAVASQLASSINAILASLARNNTNSANGQLTALDNKIRAAMKSKKISAATGDVLLAQTALIRGAL